ncbi:MAG: ATP synthase F1 subunit gamma [Bacilli bacterium]
MPSLLDTNNRIKSVESTLKITSAMKLVATAKLRGARIAYEESKEYADGINKVISSVKQCLDAEFYIKKRTSGKDLYVVIGSEIGLCGGYNTNMFKLFEDKTDCLFVTLGKKAVSYFEHRSQYEVIYSKIDISDHPSLHKTKELGNLLLKMYDNMELKSLNIVYTKYVNSVTFEPSIMKVFPLDKNEENRIIDFEPSSSQILKVGLPRYVDALIYVSMKESLVSEYASRRLAMENATDNASELIDNLLIARNRARQSAITQEISEIVAGAEAL